MNSSHSKQSSLVNHDLANDQNEKVITSPKDSIQSSKNSEQSEKQNLKIRVYQNSGIHIIQDSNVVIFQKAKKNTTEYITKVCPNGFKFNK